MDVSWREIVWDTVKMGAQGVAVALGLLFLGFFALVSAVAFELTWFLMGELFWAFLF